MTRKVVIRDEAIEDLDYSSATIGEHSPHASVVFLQEVQSAFELLAEMPGVGARRDYGKPGLAGMRMWSISRFRKYLIFYLTFNDRIEIVRVLHSSQDVPSLLGSA